MYIHSVPVNMCRSVTRSYMATVCASTCMVCTNTASKRTPQGLDVHCSMDRDIRFATQHACTVYKKHVHVYGPHDTAGFASTVRVRATLIGCAVLHKKESHV